MLVGVISDTHGLTRPEAEAALAGAEHILHAGDVGRPEVLERLERIAPVTAIRGDVDVAPWADRLPAEARVTLGGHAIHVIHDLKALGFDPAAEGVAAVVSGHSHKPRIEQAGGVLLLNPGAAGPRRFRLPVTVALMRVSGEGVSAELRELAV